VDEALVRRADELLPVRVDVLAEPRVGLVDLAVDRELEQVVELLFGQPLVDEAELDRRLLDPLREVVLVEGEAQLSVLQYVVGAGFVVSSSGCLVSHVVLSPGPHLP
jgi:hypothetical protein